ncbi:MAG: lipase family protein [Mycobacteriaceae bacterium]
MNTSTIIKKLSLTALSCTVAAVALASTAGVVIADTPAVPPGDVFNPFMAESFGTAQIASIDQINAPLSNNDPFYDEPEIAADTAPGTLLKVLPVAIQVVGIRPQTIDAYKIMHTFTNLTTNTIDISTGLIMVPKDERSNAERGIVGYDEAIDSVGSYCGASTQWTGGDQMDGALYSALGPAVMMFERGLAIVMTDVGNDGSKERRPFSALDFSAPASLDMLRAALQVKEIGFSPTAPIGLFGIAGGGSIAARAAEIQSEYAPELNIKGTVLEGMAVDPANMERVSDGGVGAGFAFANILGLAPAYPEMEVEQHLSPLGRQVADYYNTQCQTPAYFTMPFVPLGLLFDSPIPSEIPSFAAVYEKNRLGAKAPKAPVMISSCDGPGPMSLVPAEDAANLAEFYSTSGTEVTYEPTPCSAEAMLTNLYKWGTDLFGMQTIDWLTEKIMS